MKSFENYSAAFLLFLLATPSLAGGDPQYGTWNDMPGAGVGSQIINGQINLQTQWSNLKSPWTRWAATRSRRARPPAT